METETAPELILASGSARRRELLQMCGYEFETIPSSADESAVEASAPEELVERLSLVKARTVFDSLPPERRRNAVVLGSDTVVVLGGNIIGKPSSKEEAFRMLRAESGRENTVFTGVCVIRCGEDPQTGELRVLEETAADAANVFFAPLTDEEIEDYIATGDPLDKAGAYGIQGSFSMFIERIEGSYFTVMGLPLHLAYRMLKRAGVVRKAGR